MRVLFIIDPISRLELQWDNSLALLREMFSRGHQCFTCDVGDIIYDRNRIRVHAQTIKPDPLLKHGLLAAAIGIRDLPSFDLVLIRKEPPFNDAYYYLTLLLESPAKIIPISNHPAGIRNTNEKLGTLLFPDWIPETIVTSSWEEILEFQKTLKDAIVIKPLNQKGGKGVFLLERNARERKQRLQNALKGKKTVLAQRHIKSRKDKRILILNGEILGAFEKHAPQNDFRTNLSLAGTYHPTTLDRRDRRLAGEIAPYLAQEGLHLVGIDVMEGRLLDLNVTCPAGLTVLKALYPELSPLQDWASFLERLRPR